MSDEQTIGESPLGEELRAVGAEFDYAQAKWGGRFDSRNTINDYSAYIGAYLGDAVKIENQDKPDVQYAMLIKVANLALTAALGVRTDTIAQRHYDADRSEIPVGHEHGAGREFQR